MQEFNKFNLKTPYAVILSILIICLTTFVFWIFFKTDYLVFLIIGIVLVTFILWAIIYSRISKVILTESEVIIKTPFGTKKLNYSEIKTLGVYGISKYPFLVEKENHDKILFFEQKFIYLSTKPDFFPLFLKQPKDYIDFHYRKEIYAIIERKIKACT